MPQKTFYKFVEPKSSSNASSMLLSSNSSTFASEGIVLLRAREFNGAWLDAGFEYIEIFFAIADGCDEGCGFTLNVTGRT